MRFWEQRGDGGLALVASAVLTQAGLNVDGTGTRAYDSQNLNVNGGSVFFADVTAVTGTIPATPGPHGQAGRGMIAAARNRTKGDFMKSLPLAAQYKGVQETAGPNDGPVLKAIREALLSPGAPPCSWCAMFVAWVLIRAYCPLPGPVGPSHKIWLRNTLGFTGTFFVESTRDWLFHAEQRGMITTEPCEGDLFILLKPDGIPHHIGFVTENVAPLFHTIEGNTNAGGSVNGDGVYERTRAMEEGVRFISLPSALKA